MKYDFARLLCIMLSILLTLSIFQMFSPKIASAASANVVNGIQFKDTDGNVVHAHGGGMIKVDGYYYWFGENRSPNGSFKAVSAYRLITSGATGWNPNQAKYATASSIEGTWSNTINFGDGTTYGSQSAYVIPVEGVQTTSYLYLGDRWAGAWRGPVQDSQ